MPQRSTTVCHLATSTTTCIDTTTFVSIAHVLSTIQESFYILPGAISPDSNMSSQDACYITDLSTELIYHILEFVPPESHLDFACTCKRIADCSSDVLRRHQDAYSKYRVASDISPTTVPTLLRSIFGRDDPILAWHVRSIEIWDDRMKWSDWKDVQFDQPGDGPADAEVGDAADVGGETENMDVDSPPWKWQDDELDEYLEDIDGQLEEAAKLSDSDILTDAHEQFTGGCDGILKMLLISYCPRLRTVKFITQLCHDKSTLGWLRMMIQGSIKYGSHWPPGISNIQEIAVGVDSDTRMTVTEWELDPENRAMDTFATLLRLPRLNSIYYKNLERPGHDDNTEYAHPTLMPKHSSTVKHIFLDDCGDMPNKFRRALTEAPIALETFTLRAGNNPDRMDDADILISSICTEQSASLHTLMLYGPYSYDTIHGYRCSCYRNEELSNARHLKTVAIDASDVDLDCMYSCSGDDRNWTEEDSRKFFIKWFCETAFPDSVEELIFWGDVDHHMRHSEGKFLDWLEEALIKAIRSANPVGDEKDEKDDDDEDDDDCFYDLKAVYLEEIERQYHASQSVHRVSNTHKVHFQKLIEVGNEAGVDIHTLTNRAPPKHAHSFPTAPDKYDLVSGPWWERRDETKDWVFDVYKGRRVPPGCGKCGACKTCLNVYSKKLWSTIR
jgi:hypothetical protein